MGPIPVISELGGGNTSYFTLASLNNWRKSVSEYDLKVTYLVILAFTIMRAHSMQGESVQYIVEFAMLTPYRAA